MVADQQGVFHGTGRNYKCLKNEGNDEQPGHKYRGNARHRLRKAFFLLFRFLRFSEQKGFLKKSLWINAPCETCGPTLLFAIDGPAFVLNERVYHWNCQLPLPLLQTDKLPADARRCWPGEQIPNNGCPRFVRGYHP